VRRIRVRSADRTLATRDTVARMLRTFSVSFHACTTALFIAASGCGPKTASQTEPPAEQGADPAEQGADPAEQGGGEEPAASERPTLSREECAAHSGVIVGDIGDGAIHRPDYRCENGAPPLGTIAADPGDAVAIEGEVCCPT